MNILVCISSVPDTTTSPPNRVTPSPLSTPSLEPDTKTNTSEEKSETRAAGIPPDKLEAFEAEYTMSPALDPAMPPEAIICETLICLDEKSLAILN